MGHLLCVIPRSSQTEQSGKLWAAGNAMASGSHGLSQPRAPGAFPATARVRGGSALGRALGLCPRFHSRAMAPGDGRSAWKPWQSGDKVQRGEGPVMAGSVLGFSPRRTAGPHGTHRVLEGWVCQHSRAVRAGGSRCGSSLGSNAPVEPWKLLQGGCRAPAAKSILLWGIVFNLTA